VTSSAEFNFFVDAEAAAMSVDSYPDSESGSCSLHIVPWEVGIKASSTLEFRKDVLGVMNTPQIQLLNAIEATNLGKAKDTWLPPDAVVMACAINPNIIQTSGEYYARVEVAGTHTRGMLAVDKANTLGQPPNVNLITNVNVEAYESYLIWAAGGPIPEGLLSDLSLRPCSNNAKRARLDGSKISGNIRSRY